MHECVSFPSFLVCYRICDGHCGNDCWCPHSFCNRSAYLVTAVVLLLIGMILASCLYFHWRKTTLHAYQVVETVHAYQVVKTDLPQTIDKDNKSHQHQSDKVERGMVDDDDTVVTEVCYDL